MTKIYLIRHGESEWNKNKKVQGQVDTKLTELGKKQAKCLAVKLKNHNIDTIYSSDLSRACDTAKIIGKDINRSVICSESIREINFGPWEGLNKIEIQKNYKEEYLTWQVNPEALKIAGAESLDELRKRVKEWIEIVLIEDKSKDIAIVSHSATLKILILELLGIPLTHYKNLSISNVGLSIIECRDYNNVLIKLNDVSHLEGI